MTTLCRLSALLPLLAALHAGPLAASAPADPVTPAGGTCISRLPCGEAGVVYGNDQPGPGAGGGHTLRDLQPEWTLALGAPTLSSAKLADVNGDGVQEILITTYDPVNPYSAGRVYVLDMSGNNLPGWPAVTAGPVPSSPAVADIDNDGDVEIVVASWSYAYVWNHDGSSYPGWPKTPGGYASAALADLDGDGDLEIIHPGANSRLYVWHHDGTTFPGWPYTAPNLVQSPVVGDVDGDGALEIAAGIYQGPVSPDPFPFYVWEADGSVAGGWPVMTSGTVKAVAALGDIDSDGAVEIVACSYDASNNDYVYAWDAQGNAKPGWPVRARYARLSCVALGDLDGDGYLEVVIGGYSTSNREQVFAFNHDGTPVTGWPVELNFAGGHMNVNNSPIIADIDGDPTQIEVIVKAYDHIFALHADGQLVDGFPFYLSDNNNTGTNSPTQAVGDLDGDGDVEYVFVSTYGNVAFFDEPHSFTPALAFWPVYKHDRLNTGFYAPAFLPGDLDGDGDVDLADLATLLSNYGLDEGATYEQGDIDGDGDVDLADLATLLAHYGSGG